MEGIMTKNAKYPHTCSFCGYKWMGRIMDPISCPDCKRRFTRPNNLVRGKQAAVRFVEENLIRAGVHPHVAHAEAKRKLNSIIGFGGSK